MTFQEIIKERAKVTETIHASIEASDLTREEKTQAIEEINSVNTDYLRQMEDENDAMYACFREGRQRLVEIIKSGKGARAEHNARQQFYADCDRRRAQNEATITRLFEENRKALEEIQMRYLTES